MTAAAAEPRGWAVSCRGLVHVYPGALDATPALRGVDLEVAAGETVAVVGASGSGKSTLLAVLAGLVRPTEGYVAVGPHTLAELTERQLLAVRRRGVGVVAQGGARNLLSYLSAAENLRFAMAPTQRWRRRVADRLLDEVGLGGRGAERVGALSGGEQQRLGVAAALAAEPALLLADEPTSQLDAANRDAVVDLLLRARDRDGVTVVVVTHDRAVADRLDREVAMRDGTLGPSVRSGRGWGRDAWRR